MAARHRPRGIATQIIVENQLGRDVAARPPTQRFVSGRASEQSDSKITKQMRRLGTSGGDGAGIRWTGYPAAVRETFVRLYDDSQSTRRAPVGWDQTSSPFRPRSQARGSRVSREIRYPFADGTGSVSWPTRRRRCGRRCGRRESDDERYGRSSASWSRCRFLDARSSHHQRLRHSGRPRRRRSPAHGLATGRSVNDTVSSRSASSTRGEGEPNAPAETRMIASSRAGRCWPTCAAQGSSSPRRHTRWSSRAASARARSSSRC